MSDRARLEINAELAALGLRRRRRFGLALVIWFGATAGVALGVGSTGDVASPVLFGVLLAALGLLGALALALAFGLVFPRPATLRRAVIVGLAAGMAAVAGMSGEAQSAGGSGAMCLGEGTALTFVAVLGVLWAGRGGVARRHGPIGALLGLGSATAGVAMLQVLCPDRSLGHLLLWHGGVLVTGLLLAAVLHRMMPGPRESPEEAE